MKFSISWILVIFLYHKASMGRRLWDCNNKFEILSFVMISKYHPRNFELVHTEHALKKILEIKIKK